MTTNRTDVYSSSITQNSQQIYKFFLLDIMNLNLQKKSFTFYHTVKTQKKKKTLSISQLIVEQSIEEETQNRLKNLD